MTGVLVRVYGVQEEEAISHVGDGLADASVSMHQVDVGLLGRCGLLWLWGLGCGHTGGMGCYGSEEMMMWC